MLCLALHCYLALTHASVDPPPPPSWFGGRVFTSKLLHVGVRPAALFTTDGPELGVGVTLQVTTF